MRLGTRHAYPLLPCPLAPRVLAKAIEQASGPELGEVRLVDLYRGNQIGAGKKSLGYRLTYRSDERTLSDAAAAHLRNAILERPEEEEGAVVRP